MALLRDLKTMGREMAAFARQAWLLPRDLGPVDLEGLDDDALAAPEVTICLHGLFATAGVMRPLRAQLEATTKTLSFTYPVGPGIDDLAERLAEVVDQLPAEIRIHLIGHSTGGVVIRRFADRFDDPRIAQTISLAAPYAGVRHAGRLPVRVARDLAPQSALLRQIRLSAATSTIPHLSVIAGEDRVIGQPHAHALNGHPVHVIQGVGHNTLLFDDSVAAVVREHLGRFGAPTLYDSLPPPPGVAQAA